MVSQFEATKDTIQEVTESTAQHVGRIVTILTTAVRDVTREVGNLLSDIIEMREAARRAEADRTRSDEDGPLA